MAKENIENNNSVGKDSSNPPADLSYKSENIVGSKSRTKKAAEFAETKLSPSEKVGQSTKAFNDKLKSTDFKKVNKVLIVFIIIAAIGCAIGTAALIINNNNANTEESEIDEETLEKENEGKEEIAAARAEAEAALKKNPNDCAGAANGYVQRINDIYHLANLPEGEREENYSVADVLLDDAEDYFTNENPSLCSLLAVYTGLDYSQMEALPGLQHYYKRIVELADQLGDNDTKAKWEPIYNEIATGYEDDEDEDSSDYYDDDPSAYDQTINNTSEGEESE